MKSVAIAISVILCFGLIGGMAFSCSKSKAAAKQTLYDSLGGKTMVADPVALGKEVEQGYLTIRTIVDTALIIIEADTLVNPYFSALLYDDSVGIVSGYETLSLNLTNFLATAAGATDYSYTGMSMTAAHNPATNSRISRKVDSVAFNEFAHDIAQSATFHGINNQLISQIGDLLYKYEGQIVQP